MVTSCRGHSKRIHLCLSKASAESSSSTGNIIPTTTFSPSKQTATCDHNDREHNPYHNFLSIQTNCNLRPQRPLRSPRYLKLWSSILVQNQFLVSILEICHLLSLKPNRRNNGSTPGSHLAKCAVPGPKLRSSSQLRSFRPRRA
jgi:hypothetical protein